jgi:hypothetical protein
VTNLQTLEPGGAAVLQRAGYGGAVDQGGQASGEDNSAELPRFRSNEARLGLSVLADNLGNLRRLALPRKIKKWFFSLFMRVLLSVGDDVNDHNLL